MDQTKTLKGKFKNENIRITILGQSSVSKEYMIQVKVLKNTKQNKDLLDELGQTETCYRLTKNAFYTREKLEAIIKRYDLRR